MKIKTAYIIFFLVINSLSNQVQVWSYARACAVQDPGENVQHQNKGKLLHKIPFKLDRNKIILPVRIKNSRELNIILDSGMPWAGLYLFHQKFNEEFSLNASGDYNVRGAGSGRGTTTLMADSVKVSLKTADFLNQRILISQSTVTQRFPTDGVFGYTLFGNYVMEIDYDLSEIYLYDPKGFKPESGWERINLKFPNNNIPFIDASVNINGKKDIPVILYIDISSGEALELLTGPDKKFSLPDKISEKYLGTGLSGDIHGKYGIVKKLKLGKYELNDIPSAFPARKVRSKQRGADGIIANNALRRFNLIFDFSGNSLYIKPNKSFNVKFKQ